MFAESELTRLIPFRSGEPFNREKIAEGPQAARKLYETRGYINFTSVPTPQVDDEAATVAFNIDVDEGSQFHFGELDVQGMEPPHRKIMLAAWEGLSGRTYNTDDADKFFNRFFRSPLPNIQPGDYTIRKIDEYHHSVSYSVQLDPYLRYRVNRNGRLEQVESR